MKPNELKQIKSKYGGKMSYFCRDNFGIILENCGMLFDILSKNFNYDKSLFADIINGNKEQDFKNFIFEIYHRSNKEKLAEEQDAIPQSPFELLKRMGYTLTKCETNKDVLSFKRYWHKDEELCTFRDGDRINNNLIFFAIKDNIDAIRREDFKYPERQDAYGVSAISIQFHKRNGHLSIKNRYNHAVENCDTTFGNNLDNIIEGLGKAFKDAYDIKIKLGKINCFELENYVQCNKGKFYKYNYEIDNSYFCKNNITISNSIVTEYDKGRYDLVDYFLVDKKEKSISDLTSLKDSFINYFDNNIAKIEVNKNGLNRKFNITSLNGEECYFIVNENNQIIEYNNPYLRVVEDYFCYYNEVITVLKLDNLEIVGNNFCWFNKAMTTLELNSLKTVEGNFFYWNRAMTTLELNSLESVGSRFFHNNDAMVSLELNSLKAVKDNFFYSDQVMTSLELNSLKTVRNNFFYNNKAMTTLKLNSLETVGNDFFFHNEAMTTLELNSLESVGSRFFFYNEAMVSLELNSLETVRDDFFYLNKAIASLELNSLETVGNNFFFYNEAMVSLELNSLEIVGNGFFYRNKAIAFLKLNSLKRVGHSFLFNNNGIAALELNSLESTGDGFFFYNEAMVSLKLNSLETVRDDFFYHNKAIAALKLNSLEAVGR